jgi:hypothetical protein
MQNHNSTNASTLTLHQVAELVPNRRGTGHVHPQTIRRRIARGEFPEPDVRFADGTLLWHTSTLRAAKVLPPEVA